VEVKRKAYYLLSGKAHKR